MVCYDKPMHIAASHLLCLELNLYLSHLMSIIQGESLGFIYSGQHGILLYKHNGWKLGAECWLESSFHVRKGDTDKSVSLCNAFTVNQEIMPWGGDGGYSSVPSTNSSEKREQYGYCY